MSFLRWFFGKRHEPKNLIYPFRRLNAALREKDFVLYENLKHLPPSAFARHWREVYPEDFR